MTAATAAPTNSSHSNGEENVTPTPPQWLESMDLSVLNQHLTVQWKEQQQQQPTKTATSSSSHKRNNNNKGKVWKAMARSNFELIALKRRQDFEAADQFWDKCLFHHDMAREQVIGDRPEAFAHALNNLSNKFPTKQSLFKPCEFRLLSTLGEGGFGSVYRAVHIPTGHEVALKQIDRESSDIEVKEQRLMPLDCGIVPCYGTFLARGNNDDTPLAPLKTWMILKLCPGGSLLDLLEAQQTLPEKDAARITRQLTKIVKRLHARGIVHNDIKPHNVLFDDDGRVMLCDLGVATKHDEWQPKRIGGTFSYMAPEKMKGRKHRNAQYYSHQSFDVWAIGCLLYEMLFLKLPFDTVCVADLVPFETFAGQQQPSEKLNNFQQLMDGYDKLRIPKTASADVKCLLMQLLSVDVDQRLAINKIKKHSWVKRHAGKWNDRVMVQLRLLAGQNDKYNDKLVATSNNNKTAAATKQQQQHPTDSETTALSLSGRISSRQLCQPQPQEEDCATAVVVMEV